MINTSPQMSNVEVCVCASLFVFYIYHSWRYDRFRGMQFWKPAYRSGRFHVLMRVLYFFGLPIFAGQAYALGRLKYSYGFFPMKAGGGPIPYLFWRPDDRATLLPIFICQAIAWGAETAVHLEELCFWWFLMHLDKTSGPWLSSWPFRVFVGGSIATTATLVAIVVTQQGDYFQLAALLYLVAAVSGLAITCTFMRIIAMFPAWLDSTQRAGAPSELIIRLYGFGQMNILRVGARIMFMIPMLILSIDGLTKHKWINRMPILVDSFIIIENIAFGVQGAITLLVFLPRSYATECGFDPSTRSARLAPEQPAQYQPLSGTSSNNKRSDAEVHINPSVPFQHSQRGFPPPMHSPSSTWSQDGAELESGIAESPGVGFPKGAYHRPIYSPESSMGNEINYEAIPIQPTSPLPLNVQPENRLHPAIRFFKSPIDPIM